MSKTVTVEIDDESLAVFEDLAKRSNREAGGLISDAVRVFALAVDQRGVEDEWVPSEEDLAAIREGDEAVARGEVFTHEDVMAEAKRITRGEGR